MTGIEATETLNKSTILLFFSNKLPMAIPALRESDLPAIEYSQNQSTASQPVYRKKREENTQANSQINKQIKKKTEWKERGRKKEKSTHPYTNKRTNTCKKSAREREKRKKKRER